MAGLTTYENIPGMPVEFKNNSYTTQAATTYSTKSMLILGTAEDGPILEPVQVDQNSIKIFGKASKGSYVSNNSTLVKDFEHAWNIGCRDIRVMRITGQEATSTLKTDEGLGFEVSKVEENKGIVGGNDVTELTLVNTPIEGTVKLYCKGVLVPNGYTIAGKVVTISKNACDAGAILSFVYSYLPTVTKEESLTVSEGKTVTLPIDPVSIEKVLYSGAELTLDTDYTVAGKVITIASEAISEGASVNVTYKYVSSTPISVSENNNNGETYVSLHSAKSMTLAKTPVADSVRVYISNKEVSSRDVWTISGANITLNKNYFSKSEPIVVSYLYEQEVAQFASIVVSSQYGGEIYNQSKIQVQTIRDNEENYFEKVIYITKPESKKTGALEEPLTFKSSDYPTLMSLANAINTHRGNDVFKAYTNNPDALTIELQDTEVFFSGGDNGLNCTKQELFDSLSGTRDGEGYIVKQGAYQILENYIVDFIVPGGVYADDYVAGRNKDFAYELALVCAIITNRTKTTLGAIPMSPCTDTSLIGVQKHTNKLLAYTNTYPLRDENGNLVLDSDSETMDIGRYIHVVAGPDPLVLNSELGVVLGNPAIQYVAELTLLKPQSSPLNKNLHGIKGLRYNFQTPQIDNLLGSRFIVFNNKIAKSGSTSYKMVDGITCAYVGSEYARTTTLRCLQEIVDEFREASEPFFGEPPSVENRNALAAAISKRKDALITQGVAEDISFQLVITQQDYLLGQATLEVDVIPPKEFRKINMVVGLKNTI